MDAAAPETPPPSPARPPPSTRPGEDPSTDVNKGTEDLSIAGEEDPGSAIDTTDMAPIPAARPTTEKPGTPQPQPPD
jgi:hypothetical protein